MSKTILCTLADKYQTDKGGESTMYGGVMGGGTVIFRLKYDGSTATS